MEKLIICSRRDSPEVVLDPISRIFSFKGVCHPENVTKFFEPVMQWLDGFENEIKNKPFCHEIKVTIFFKYFNSATYKYLITLLQKFHKLTSYSLAISVDWHYEKDDDDMRESGVELFEYSGIKLPYTCIESGEL